MENRTRITVDVHILNRISMNDEFIDECINKMRIIWDKVNHYLPEKERNEMNRLRDKFNRLRGQCKQLHDLFITEVNKVDKGG